MCSYGECLEQVQVTKALSFSCSNCVRMNSSILLKLNLNPRHVGTQSKLGHWHWHVSHRFTGRCSSSSYCHATPTRSHTGFLGFNEMKNYFNKFTLRLTSSLGSILKENLSREALRSQLKVQCADSSADKYRGNDRWVQKPKLTGKIHFTLDIMGQQVRRLLQGKRKVSRDRSMSIHARRCHPKRRNIGRTVKF